MRPRKTAPRLSQSDEVIRRRRETIVIEPRDQIRIVTALERLPETEGFVGWRTRAFAYLLWDGALRPGAAIWLDIEEVVKDPTPSSSRISVVQEAVLRPCEGNMYKARPFGMTDRSREAIADYLSVARTDGWLSNANRLKGPLWIATQPQGSQKRLSQRTAMHAWRSFVEATPGLAQNDYQLEDLVLTGRVAFLKAAKGSTDVMSDHAGLNKQWAAHAYSDHVESKSNTRDVLAQLSQKFRRKG